MVKGEESKGELDFQFSFVGAVVPRAVAADFSETRQTRVRVQVRSASENGPGVTPRKFRGNAVENSALPRGKFGVTLWNLRGRRRPNPPISVMQEDGSGDSF